MLAAAPQQRTTKLAPALTAPAPPLSSASRPAQESLRKYSVVPVVTRNLVADDELCGYKVPKGAWIICHIQVGGAQRSAAAARRRGPRWRRSAAPPAGAGVARGLEW